jgi:hypothetical protein
MQPTGSSLQIVPFAIVVALYGLIPFCIWKFYQILSKINDNLDGIKQAITEASARGPGNDA